MRIQRATVDDLPAIRQVARVLRVPGCRWCNWHTLEIIRPAILEKRCFVAKHAGKIIGVMNINSGGRWMQIESLAVRRSLHRHGVGSQLIRFAVCLAQKKGGSALFVETFSFYGAARFYLRSGFRICERDRYRGATWYQFRMPISRRTAAVAAQKCRLFVSFPRIPGGGSSFDVEGVGVADTD